MKIIIHMIFVFAGMVLSIFPLVAMRGANGISAAANAVSKATADGDISSVIIKNKDAMLAIASEAEALKPNSSIDSAHLNHTSAHNQAEKDSNKQEEIVWVGTDTEAALYNGQTAKSYTSAPESVQSSAGNTVSKNNKSKHLAKKLKANIRNNDLPLTRNGDGTLALKSPKEKIPCQYGCGYSATLMGTLNKHYRRIHCDQLEKEGQEKDDLEKKYALNLAATQSAELTLL